MTAASGGEASTASESSGTNACRAQTVTFDRPWKNYWQEEITIEFTVEAGRDYTVHASEDTEISGTRDPAESLLEISPVSLVYCAPVLLIDRAVHKPTGPPARTAVWVEDAANGGTVGGTPLPRPPAKPACDKPVIER